MLSTGQIGNISETKAALAALERGWPVFTTQGNSCQYDMIYDVKGCLFRIQVKTASYSPGCSTISVHTTRRVGTGHKRRISYYPTDFDFLVAVYQQNFWVIPMPEIKGRQCVSLGPSAAPYLNAWPLIEQEAARRGTASMLGAASVADLEEHYGHPGAL